MIATNGVPRQAFTSVTENSARFGSVSQFGPCAISPECTSAQLMTLKLGLNIHSHAIAPSTVGTIQGNITAARTRRWKRKASFRMSASPTPKTRRIVTDPAVKISVLRMVWR